MVKLEEKSIAKLAKSSLPLMIFRIPISIGNLFGVPYIPPHPTSPFLPFVPLPVNS
jgi:hypothetical protein